MLDPKPRSELQWTTASEPAGMRLSAQIVVEKTGQPARLGFSFNGGWPSFDSRETSGMLFPVGPFTHFTPAHTAWEFPLDATVLQHDWNSLMVTNCAQEVVSCSKPIRLSALRI